MVKVVIDGSTQLFKGVSSVSDVLDQVNEKLGVAKKETRMKFEVRGRGESYFINKAGDSEYRHLKEFTTSKDAFDYRNSNYNDLVAAWEDVKNRDNVKKDDVRGAENRQRTAEDYRKGKDVTTDEFAATFGFRGGQFGKWVSHGSNAKERQWMLNSAYDAMMDLSNILDIPPKAISLNGELGMSFGARGSGAASAHYESGELVINLTKTRGAGMLAHEWFHALDNYFQRNRNAPMNNKRETRYITYLPEPMMVHKGLSAMPAITKETLNNMHERFPNSNQYDPQYWEPDQKHPEGVRPEVEAKFAELVQALNNSPMTARASIIDKGKSDGYWSRIIERAARSFENYVMAKMAEKGYHNDYLANVVNIAEFKRDAGRYPYLKEEELAPVVDAFDNLFGEIKTKETNQGTALFSRRTSPATGITEQSLRDTFTRKFPQLSKALDKMLARGESKQKGGVVLASSDGLAQAFADKTGRTLEAAKAALQMSVDGNPLLDIRYSQDGDIQAFYDPKSGMTFMVTDNLDPETAANVLLHEATHGNQNHAVDKAGTRLLITVSNMSGGKLRTYLDEAANRMVAAGAAEWDGNTLVITDEQEAAPYIVEVIADKAREAGFSAIDGKFMDWVDGISPTLGKFMRDFVAMVRGALLRHGVILKNPTVDDLFAFAQASMNRASNGGVQTGNRDVVSRSAINALTKFWRNLAGSDSAFTYPVSAAKELAAVAKAVDPDMNVSPLLDGSPKRRTKATRQYVVTMPKGGTAYVYEFGRDIQIDASGLTPGVSRGSALYAAIANYAHNTGKVFEGDSAGLNAIGSMRRLENMISTALKFGSTDHIRPHDLQKNPTKDMQSLGIKGINWSTGDFEFNLDQMLKASHAFMSNMIPEISHVELTEYGFLNVETGEWLDEAAFSRIADEATEELRNRSSENGAHGGAGSAARIGSNGIKRAIITGSVLRGTGAAGGRHLLAQDGRDLHPDLKGILYSKAGDNVSDSTAGNRTIDEADLRALRRIASGLEKPGVFLRITANGEAIATGHTGARIPKSFTDFAKENNLKFVAIVDNGGIPGNLFFNTGSNPGIRFGTGDAWTEPMPTEYRENGAMYHEEIGDNERVERTGKVRFSRSSGAMHSQGNIPGTTVPPAPPPSQSNLGLTGGQNGNAATFDKPDPSRLDSLIYTLQDKNIDLKRVTQAIKDAGRSIADSVNAYLQEELYHGRAATRTKQFIQDELDPLINDMRARNVKMADFEEYLWMRHAKERNEQIAKVNPDMPDGGSGINTRDAIDYLKGLPADKRKAYESLAKRIDKINHDTRQTWVKYGIESQDTVDAMESAYQHYVPLMREDMDHAHGTGIGQGFSIKGNSTKRATGSNRAVVDILANMAQAREKAIIRGEKNRVSTALIGLAALNPNAEFWKIDTPPTVRTVNDRTGLVEDRIDPSYKNRDNVIMARIPYADGKIVDHSVVFNERDERAMRMAQSLKNLDQDQIGEVLGAASSITRYFASINTQYNPIFGVINLTRDVQGAMLNLSSTPLAGKQTAVLGNTLSALRGIYADIRDHRKGKQPSSVWAQLWDEFQKEGGQTGYRDMFKNAKERAEALEKGLDPDWWQTTKVGKVLTIGGALSLPEKVLADKAIRPLFDWLSDYNETMENSVRLAAYKVAKESGMSNQQAASLAKNLTVNFNRKGEIGRQVGALYAFFNASVQGTARLAETLKGPAGKRILAGGLLLGAMQAMMLAAAGFGDDEPPEFVRDRAIIIPTGNGKYISIPMPLGFNAIPNFGRIMTEFVMSGFKDPQKRFVHIVDMLLDVTNPIGNAGLSMQTVAPTLLDPIAALSENRDWTGKPIARKDFNALNPTPGFTRSKDTASVFSKTLSEGINYLTGGTKYKPGAVSPTPDQIDYLIGQLTGGVGREYLKVEQTATSAFSGEELPMHKIPLLGRFVGDTTGQSSQGSTFYSNLREINEHENEIKGRRAHHEDVQGYIHDNPESRLVATANKTETEVSKLRKLKRKLIENDAPKERIKQIEDRITEKMKRLNDRVKTLKEAA
jgi:hypothetical protein